MKLTNIRDEKFKIIYLFICLSTGEKPSNHFVTIQMPIASFIDKPSILH